MSDSPTTRLLKNQRDAARAEVRDLKARLKAAAKRLDPLIDWEMGEGSRGEVYDPLRDVLKPLDLKNKSWRKARGEGR